MIQAHVVGAVIVLVGATVFFVFALYCARTGKHADLLMRMRTGVVALAGAEVAVGALLYAMGERPVENLHILYGLVSVAAIPMAASFALEAPPKGRAGALAAGAGLMLIMIWRLWETGSG